MASFYQNLQATASRLLQSKGQNLTFSREVETGFNPGTGVKTNTTTTYTGYGAAFDYMASEIDGTIIQAGDIKLMLEKTATAPEINDTVTIDSVVYRLMDVKKTAPGGIVVKYDCRLRK